MDDHPLSEQCIRRAADGDQESFARISSRMMPLLLSQVRSFHADGVDEEDLFQEASLGLLSAVRTFRTDGGAAFTTYATACIRNRLTSALRGTVSRQVLPLDEDTPAADDGTDPADLLQQQEDALRLQQQLLQRLTPLEYRVLVARLQGCSYQEIACRLSVGTKTVDNAVQRLRRKMSGLL